MVLWCLVSLYHCLPTKIRNHAPQGEHRPSSIWNEGCCSRQKSLEQCHLTTATQWKGWENPERAKEGDGYTCGFWIWDEVSNSRMLGPLINLHCQYFHLMVINSSVSVMMHSWFSLCIETPVLIALLSTPTSKLPRPKGGPNYISQSLIKPRHKVIHHSHRFHMISSVLTDVKPL